MDDLISLNTTKDKLETITGPSLGGEDEDRQSDDDSVCADIDKWATSSVEDSNSQIIESVRVKELEEEQQRLNESLIALSTHFARIQFRIQQISQAPGEKRDEMLRELSDLASSECVDICQIKRNLLENSQKPLPKSAESANMLNLINELRQHLEELEEYAYKQGQLPKGDLPISEIKRRQLLVSEKLRDKLRLEIEIEKPTPSQFLDSLEENLDKALAPFKQKDKLVGQLHTQIFDLERFVKVLQTELGSPPPSPTDKRRSSNPTNEFAAQNTTNKASDNKNFDSFEFLQSPIENTETSLLGRLWRAKGTKKKFERNELKHSVLGNHYGDQRAQLELVVHDVVQTLKRNQILHIERPERENLPVEQLNKQLSEYSQSESVVSIIRKSFCPALKNLLEHGLREIISPSPADGSVLSFLGLDSLRNKNAVNSKYLHPEMRKFDGFKIEHIWDVLQLYLKLSRSLEMRDAIVSNLSETFKLDKVDGKTATSKQILLCTIENILNSHSRLKRSPDTMWKAFVCAALNRNRLPAWIRIIFRSELVVKKCYYDWSYVCRTGCDDIRQLFEGLHEFNFDLPVDLAVRSFEQIREAF